MVKFYKKKQITSFSWYTGTLQKSINRNAV